MIHPLWWSRPFHISSLRRNSELKSWMDKRANLFRRHHSTKCLMNATRLSDTLALIWIQVDESRRQSERRAIPVTLLSSWFYWPAPSKSLLFPSSIRQWASSRHYYDYCEKPEGFLPTKTAPTTMRLVGYPFWNFPMIDIMRKHKRLRWWDTVM